ncbi:MAG: spermidine synthase [Patescibacteria group bacterium]
MLYILVFMSGAVLMSLEMIGSRLLAPTFGTSIYVWGSLITVVMAALTLGYYLGGKIADRFPRPGAMAAILAAAGLLTGILPLWTAPANRLLDGLEPRLGTLLAATAFFFLPSLFMATISPFGIKLAGRSMATIGNTAGRMAAISSGGSILGTLVTSFFLIPVMGVRNIVHALGLVLLILALLAFIALGRERGRGRLPLAGATLGAIILLALGWRFAPPAYGPHGTWGARTLYTADSLYHHIVVDEVGNERHLHFDNSWQSGMYLDDPLRANFEYTSYLHLGVVARPRPRRMLLIGLGGGSAVTRFLHDYPSLARVDVVEIDPAVVSVARRYFRLPVDDSRLRINVQDGRLYVDRLAREIAAGRAEPYDLVLVDAYNADTVPYHLTTLEFCRSLRAILAPDGVVAANLIGSVIGPDSLLVRAMARTYGTAFPQIYLFPIGYSGMADWRAVQNIILVGTQQVRRWSAMDWIAEAKRLHNTGEITEAVPAFAEMLVEDRAAAGEEALRSALLLTDDYAPVDTLKKLL